jgi:hypothetical protein
LENVKKVTSEINEKVKSIDNIRKVSDLQIEIKKNYILRKEEYDKELQRLKKEKKDFDNLVEPIKINIVETGRTYIYSSELFVSFNEKFHEEKLLVYLFSDCIVWLRQTENDEQGCEFLDMISLKSNTLPWCKELYCDKRCFQLITEKKSVVKI